MNIALIIPFHFNVHSSLLLPLVIQGLVFSIILAWRGWKENRLADKLLAALLFLITTNVANWMLGFAGWYDSHDGYTTFMFYFIWSHNFAYGPLVWLYFRSLTNHQFRIKGKEWFHFLPLAIITTIHVGTFLSDIVIDHWISGTPLPYFHGTRGYFAEFGLGIWDTLSFILQNLSLLIYFSYTYSQYRSYRQYINENFSDTHPISFHWLRNFLTAFLLFLVISLVFTVVENVFGIYLDYKQKWYGNFIWGIIIYYISIGGYGTHPNFLIALQFNPTNKVPTQEKESNPEKNPWKEKLLDHLTSEKPYLNPQLTLTDLATQLNTSPSTISKTINSCFKQNFNDYINTYRVEDVKRKLQDGTDSHLSLLGIALDSGFNSKATFNRAFKKHTKLSPSEFLKSQIK